MTGWRILQRVLAFTGLVLLAPVLAVIAILVRLDSPGSVIYRGRRVGRAGRELRIHKFRSMSAAMSGAAITGSADQRITAVGRRLRSLRLDEIPQLWDVVRGDMLLVGPRPEAPEFVDLTHPDWQEILSVPPGITGPTQLQFADEADLLAEGDIEATYRDHLLPAKMASDLAYVRGQSVRSDIAVLVRTVRFAVGRR